MNENDEPAVALPLTDPEVENQNQENQQIEPATLQTRFPTPQRENL